MNPIAPRRIPGPTLNKAQRTAVLVVLSVLVLVWIIASHGHSATSTSSSRTGCLVSHGTYSGSVYAKPSETLRNECLVESPWMRLAQHSVRLPASPGGSDASNGKVIDDWLWIDYHDRINVLVEAPSRPTAAAAIAEEGRSAAAGSSQQRRGEISFMILSQTKYALEKKSLAIVGGIIEPDEEAATAAKREVQEELGVTCSSWETLGNRFRTDVNRGMGWVHPYLARDCSYSNDVTNANDENGNSNQVAEVGGRDAEKQSLQIMKFSEVKRAVMDGRFMEVQWSNTVALAMLHLSSSEESL